MSSELLSEIKACLHGGNQIDKTLHLFRQIHHLSGPLLHDIISASDDIDHDVQILLYTWKDIIDALESHLETVAFTWDKAEDNTCESTATTTAIDEILLCISQLYKDIATISSKYRDLEYDDDDDDDESSKEAIAEHYLNWAIAAKRAGLLEECVKAHMKRMKALPDLVQTDAVRLIGLHNREEADGNISIREVTTTGLFETQLVTRGVDGCSYIANIPTENAIQLGKRTAHIFANANYTLQKCTEILQQALSSNTDESSCAFNPKRIYSANSFFNHRRDVIAIYDELKQNDDLKVLAFLFLFGISLKETQVEAAIGRDNIQVLFESGILARNVVDKTMVLGEVQIYPMNTDTFEDDEREDQSQSVYIMTDWSLESLRLPKHAIMTIGYDSLELVALAAGVDVFNSTISTSNSSRVLDLCCGCGIQGIFSAKKSTSWGDSSIRCELISMDINSRACQFVCANAALNDLVSQENTIYAIEADLFSPLQLHHEVEGVPPPANFIGKVDMILSNPPFVAVPFANNPRLDAALYAAGGGYDGMHLVREIVNKSFMCLSDGNGCPQLLMVTELPNVETSCNLLESFLDDTKCVQINVAYIKDDVEQMEDYATEREEEAGRQVIGRNWNPTTGLVKNRALVLISISRDVKRNKTKHGLFCFNEKADNSSSSCDADEEDQFLTTNGVAYARRHLIVMPNKSPEMGKMVNNNSLLQVEQLEHDALLPYLSTSTPFSRHIKQQLQVEGYVVIPNVLSREECEVELSRLWDFVEATSPGVSRDDPNSWYPNPNNATTNPQAKGISTSTHSPDPWPHSGWGFLPDMCQSFGAGWLFGELREKLADRIFEPLFGTSELHSSKEGFTFHRPTALGVASNGALHPFLDRERPRVAGKVQTKGRGEHFDQCAAHTGLQCIQSSTAFIDQDMDGADGCFQCWPRSHVEHPRMTKDIWRARSDWVPLTDEELTSLEEKGLSAKKVPVGAGDVILWRSDLVHCGVGPSLPRTGFRAVSYTAMIPAKMTPAHVLREKIEHYHAMQTGDHRPNVTSRHFSAPKKTEKKHKKSSQQESESLVRGSYFADGPPVLTIRQAELYGLIPYNRKDDMDVDQLLKSLRVRINS